MKISWKTRGCRSGLLVNGTEIAYISHPGRYEGVDDYIYSMSVGGGIIERKLTSDNLEDAKEELINVVITEYNKQIAVWKECIAGYEERVSILKES